MTLQSKILHLKLEAALAVKHANGWQKLIDLYGEARATEFYTHLGLNHLESKSIEWDGLTLSREPKEHEKIAVKGIAQVQESGKEVIGAILLNLRSELIANGLSGISQLPPSRYHELVLQIPRVVHDELREQLVQVHRQGRRLVGAELEHQQGKGWLAEGSWQYPVYFDIIHQRNGFGPHDAGCIGFRCECNITHESTCKLITRFQTCTCEFKQEDDFDELDDLTDLTTSRIANDVQSRITAAASRFSLLGQSGPTLINSITNEVTSGSVSYIDRAATGLANRVINLGREDEAENRRDEWGRVEYSALLDQNVCGPCASEDGQSATNENNLQPTPNPECEGGDWCRCFHVYIQS